MPESFKVLVKELQSLGLAIEVINEEESGEPAELSAEHETIPGPVAAAAEAPEAPLAEVAAEAEAKE